LFAVAQDVVQSSRNDVEGAVQVLRLDSTNSEAFVIALKELGVWQRFATKWAIWAMRGQSAITGSNVNSESAAGS
jgi:hypothetical protein